jgi:hypothetical protein
LQNGGSADLALQIVPDLINEDLKVSFKAFIGRYAVFLL